MVLMGARGKKAMMCVARPCAIVCIVASLALLSPPYAAPHNAALDAWPRLMVWAWERPEDLSGLDRTIGVAFLARTITIAGDRFRVHPRRQPLRVSPGAALVAVTRIEDERSDALSFERDTVAALASEIAATTTLPRVVGVQVDFDAGASDRAFYRQLIRALRDRLPSTVPISITALASWCAGDNWLHGLPIDEAVPMLFRMGPVNEPFRRMGASHDSASPCRGAIGTSLDEPIDVRPEGRRVYVFNPRPWTDAALLQARRLVVR
jgi:hypothetical protein